MAVYCQVAICTEHIGEPKCWFSLALVVVPIQYKDK